MLRKEQEIAGALNDVKNIIACYGDRCDYEVLIPDVEIALKETERLLELYQGEGMTLRLRALKEKAETYLNILKSYKRKKERENIEELGE